MYWLFHRKFNCNMQWLCTIWQKIVRSLNFFNQISALYFSKILRDHKLTIFVGVFSSGIFNTAFITCGYEGLFSKPWMLRKATSNYGSRPKDCLDWGKQAPTTTTKRVKTNGCSMFIYCTCFNIVKLTLLNWSKIAQMVYDNWQWNYRFCLSWRAYPLRSIAIEQCKKKVAS